jgi:hypothetical protein
MKRAKGRLKFICLVVFAIVGFLVFAGRGPLVEPIGAYSTGPPAGFTGAPDEQTCAACHFGGPETGTFSLTAPGAYAPGQTYQITIRHVNADTSRRRWGFEMTSLAGSTMAGSFSNLTTLTQTISESGRQYIEHTLDGTFTNQTGGAQWTVNWTAPATNVGPVSFYAAGNQANNNGSTDGDRILTATATAVPIIVDPGTAPFDFDGDGKTDIGIFRPAPSEWWINRSSTSQTFAAQFGASGDAITPGDYTGDGKADIAVWRPSTGFWFVLRSEDFSFFAFPFGSTGDIPVPQDFDGDSKTDAAVFRPSGNLWFISRSSGGTDVIQFGSNGDQPVPSDFDGDGKADVAIRRPNGVNGAEWWISRSSMGILALQFGVASDLAVPSDYTGDGKTDIAFWRPSTGFWFVLRSEDLSFYAQPFGGTGDVPAPGDYDGDGKSDLAIFRPSETNWYINRSSAGVQIMQFGAPGDRPIPNAFVP